MQIFVALFRVCKTLCLLTTQDPLRVEEMKLTFEHPLKELSVEFLGACQAFE